MVTAAEVAKFWSKEAHREGEGVKVDAAANLDAGALEEDGVPPRCARRLQQAGIQQPILMRHTMTTLSIITKSFMP